MRLEHLLSGEKLNRKGFFGCTAKFVYINIDFLLGDCEKDEAGSETQVEETAGIT